VTKKLSYDSQNELLSKIQLAGQKRNEQTIPTSEPAVLYSAVSFK
jgi:hypothetical protein